MEIQEEKIAWYLSSAAVIFLLFFVLGPFALPLLYKSPKFSSLSKIILTIAVLSITIGMLFFVSSMVSQLGEQMNQIDKLLAH